MPSARIHTLLAVVLTLVLAGCGQTVTSTGDEQEIVADARALSGVDDVTVHYLDPDGEEHDGLPDDPTGWTLRLDIVHDVALSAGWAVEAIDELLADRPEPAAPRLEIWLNPVTPAEAEIAVRAYPLPATGDPVSDAYVFAGTPGVVRAVFDGETADVRVADEADLPKVADVAAVHGAGVDVVRTLDDTAELAVADVAPRPPYLPSGDGGGWPADPAAPACDPADLRLELTGSDAALGSRYLLLGATNTGAAPCAVQGHPSAGFRTLTEQLLAVAVVPSVAASAQAPRVVVPAGGRAVAMLDWNAMPTAGNPDLTYEVLVAAAPGGPVTELPLTSLVVEGGGTHAYVDIVDGGEVAVTEWRPDGASF
ncbi:DUF4232 domain-containing protein [Jiangella alkaliphila]|uniref:DUF4232 domain-containing protein n=1 Tax=Jiangella alkaliphila TaxID=419479 RepID=A0A1H2KQS4_9ACTN|nr:DUF4232 domain-containing protein [Jiangella alkaliphila]SDU71007.1 Protein of unknown function [Jiangella alkaliphila]